MPPSKVEKITLNFEKEDGTRFSLSVYSNIKIDQLKQEVSIEEKVDAKQLKVVSTQEDPDGDEVVTLKDLEDDAVLSTLSLEDEIIVVYSRHSCYLCKYYAYSRSDKHPSERFHVGHPRLVYCCQSTID